VKVAEEWLRCGK